MGGVADRDADAVEAQILEVQRLELTAGNFSSQETKQAPDGRLIHFSPRADAHQEGYPRCESGRGLPPRSKSKTEREWRRRVIGIRPIIIRPRVIIGPIAQTIAVTIIMPVAAPRAEIRCLQRLRLLHRGRRWRGGSGIDRGGAAEHQGERQDGCADPFRHLKVSSGV